MWLFKREPATEPFDFKRDHLLTSLTTFIELYNSRRSYFKTTAATVAQACKKRRDSFFDDTTRAVLGGLCGASLGGIVGALGGCVAGGLGSVFAAAVYTEHLNPLSATAGFLGGVMGGAAGATSACVLGGTIGMAAESAGYSVRDDVQMLVWCITGGATGAGVGHIFGKEVGLVGGAFGGCFGGFLGVGVTVLFMKKRKQLCQSQPIKPIIDANDSLFQSFKQNTSPLTAELTIINQISSKMDGARCVAEQSGKCLTAVSEAEKVLGRLQYSTQATSCLEKAAERCKQVSDELERMKSEAEKCLASWSN